MKYPSYSISIVLLLLSTSLLGQLKYPDVRRVPFDTVIQGIKMSDPYYWMSKKENREEVIRFARQESKLALSILDSIPGDTLSTELGNVLAALDEEIWNLTVAGGQIYYYRYIPGSGNTLCRRKNPASPEERIISKIMINGQAYSVRKRSFSTDGSLIAFMLTQKGESNPQIRILDANTGQFLKDSIAPVMFNDSRGVSMTWLPDGRSLLYTQAPPTDKHAEKYFSGKVKQHVMGTPVSGDTEIFGIGLNKSISLTPQETPYIYSFKNSPYLLARIRSGSGDNYAYAVHSADLNGPKTPWKKLKNYVNLGDGFDANGKYLYAATNGSDKYRIVKIDLGSAEPPVEFLPEQDDLIGVTDDNYATGIVAGKDVLYVLLRRLGNMQIVKVDYRTKSKSLLPVEQHTAIAGLFLSGENDLVYYQSSPVKSYQYSIYDFSKNIAQALPFGKRSVDRSAEFNYETWWAPSRDGKKIPVSVIYSRERIANRPFVIDGYGNSGSSNDMHFAPNFYPWLSRGGIYAYAHVRGGGELGEKWYLDGQYPNKINSVNDVVDIAAWIRTQKDYEASKLFVMGASAGSFLVGNSINQRPDLFTGGIYLAGLPDLATHTDAAGAREEKSVGPKTTEDGFKSNYQLSAIYHIPENKPLPSMLIIHGASDYILDISPAARYAATLQARQTANNPILFITDWESGHKGGGDEPLQILKYIFWQSGHPEFQLRK